MFTQGNSQLLRGSPRCMQWAIGKEALVVTVTARGVRVGLSVLISFGLVVGLGLAFGVPAAVPLEGRNPGQFYDAWEERANEAVQSTGIADMGTDDLVLTGTVLQIESMDFAAGRIIGAFTIPMWTIAGVLVSALVGVLVTKFWK